MPLGWRPIEISSSGSHIPGAEVTYTVVLNDTVDEEAGVEVQIRPSSLDVYSKAPPSVVTVPMGKNQTSFTARVAVALPAGWSMSATCGGETLTVTIAEL
jgi:hypothetical protein